MPCHPSDFLVICLCAEWCTTCREYRHEFEETVGLFPEVRFFWQDIEENAESLGDLEIENFPTILVCRKNWVLFFGTLRPQAEHLRRLIGTFLEQSAEQSKNHAFSGPERSAWQTDAELTGLLQELCHHS
jgi:hypothetical protein